MKAQLLSEFCGTNLLLYLYTFESSIGIQEDAWKAVGKSFGANDSGSRIRLIIDASR